MMRVIIISEIVHKMIRSIGLLLISSLIGFSTALADNVVPPEVLSDIQQECNASFAQNTYRDMSAENCIGLAVEKYKRANPSK